MAPDERDGAVAGALRHRLGVMLTATLLLFALVMLLSWRTVRLPMAVVLRLVTR